MGNTCVGVGLVSVLVLAFSIELVVAANVSLPQGNDTTDPTNKRRPKTIQDLLNPYWTYREALQLWRIYPFVLFAVGLVGNGIAFMVFIQKRMRKYSSYIYLAILAIFDQIALLGLILYVIGHEYFPKETLSQAYCNAATYIQGFANHVTSWLVVMVTIERFIATAVPLKAGRLCTVRRAFLTSIVLVICALLLNITVFWTTAFDDSRGTPRCVSNPEYEDFLLIWQWIDISLFSFIPCILLFVFNIAIVVLMNSAWKRQRRLTNNKARVGTGVFSKQITVTLLLVSFVFLICTVPAASTFIWRHIARPELGLNIGDFEGYAMFLYLNQVMNLLVVLNHCFNIILYAMSGNRFRSEMENVFLCCCPSRSIERTSTARTFTQKKRSESSSVSSAYEMAENTRKNISLENGHHNMAYKHDENSNGFDNANETKLSRGIKAKKYSINS